MKKKINTTALVNELEQSAFFRRPTPPVALPPAPPAPTVPPNDRTADIPTERTPVRRKLTRYAFEFYQDQVEQLRKLSLEDKIKGGRLGMSEMVREAVDQYLKERGKGEA